jgi:chromosome segregation ATPase
MSSPEIALLLELVLDLKKDISAVRTDISSLQEDTTRNSVVLEDHARRSTASEARLDKLERRDQMLNGFLKISLGVLGAVGSVLGILKFLH